MVKIKLGELQAKWGNTMSWLHLPEWFSKSKSNEVQNMMLRGCTDIMSWYDIIIKTHHQVKGEDTEILRATSYKER